MSGLVNQMDFFGDVFENNSYLETVKDADPLKEFAKRIGYFGEYVCEIIPRVEIQKGFTKDGIKGPDKVRSNPELNIPTLVSTGKPDPEARICIDVFFSVVEGFGVKGKVEPGQYAKESIMLRPKKGANAVEFTAQLARSTASIITGVPFEDVKLESQEWVKKYLLNTYSINEKGEIENVNIGIAGMRGAKFLVSLTENPDNDKYPRIKVVPYVEGMASVAKYEMPSFDAPSTMEPEVEEPNGFNFDDNETSAGLADALADKPLGTTASADISGADFDF